MEDRNVHDERWFREVFQATYTDLVAYARRRAGAATEADDIVSEVYAVAWRRRADIDRAAALRPWLYGIAANVLRNHRRAGSRRLQLVDRLEAQPKELADGDPSDGIGADLLAALDGLSPDDQEVLRLVAWEGLSHEEAGQALGCSPNAVGIRIHRARLRLQAELAQMQPANPSDPSVPPVQAGREAETSNNDEDAQRRGGATK